MSNPISIINNTGSVTVGGSSDLSLTIATIILASITLGIGLVTVWYMRKENKKNALLDVFKMLNNDTQKNAENALLENYRTNSLYDGQILREHLVESSAKIVWRNYDQIGLLIKRGLIAKKDFFYMFGKIVIIQHWILFQEINRRRLLGELDFMTNFTRLATDCYHYWNKKGKHRLPRDPLRNMEIHKDTIKQWEESLREELL